jgi:malate dehydrogenase (oxaloacetate-decarboxylating)
MANNAAEAIKKHRDLNGKIEVTSKGRIKTMKDLSIYYTPGVGAVSRYIADNPKEFRNLTIKSNTVAVVTDGSAVLGLGNIGPEAALPVMEGKAQLFKELAGVDAFPICLATQDTEEIFQTVKNIAPVFGGINLEDISAPRCFEVEERLKKELAIPVMHDDQHGTAVAVLAGLINALSIAEKPYNQVKVVILGAGAAGVAISKLLILYGITNIVVCDSKGVIAKSRSDLNSSKKELAQITNPDQLSGSFEEAIVGADVFLGVAGPNLVTEKNIRLMNSDPVVFAMANPTPEIMPDLAKKAGALIVATGRSDFPNQLNNALVFPGIFRGALDHQVKQITDEMKLNAAEALATLVTKPTPEKIIPNVFDKKVAPTVAAAIK